MDFLHVQNISDDHPAVQVLHELEAKAYYVDINLSHHTLALVLRTFQDILRWANMLNRRLKVGALYLLWFHFSDTTS